MTLVEELLTNNTWNFWSSNWKKRIIVDWPTSVKREAFFKDVKKKLGSGFIYERSLSRPAQYKATNKGLVKY